MSQSGNRLLLSSRRAVYTVIVVNIYNLTKIDGNSNQWTALLSRVPVAQPDVETSCCLTFI